MFIRIKKRKLSPRNGFRDTSLRLVVVESYRTDGKPRQRIIQYLGCIRMSALRDPAKKKKIILDLSQKLERCRFSVADTARLKLSLINAIFHHPPPEPKKIR